MTKTSAPTTEPIKAVLRRGASYRLIDASNPGAPAMLFTRGVERVVSQEIAERLAQHIVEVSAEMRPRVYRVGSARAFEFSGGWQPPKLDPKIRTVDGRHPSERVHDQDILTVEQLGIEQ